MRYRIETLPLMGQHLVLITAWPDGKPDRKILLHRFQIPIEDLKVDDLLHLLEAVWRSVGEVTP